MSVKTRLTAVGLPLVLIAALVPSANAAEAYERVLNGKFDTVKTPWWSSGIAPSTVVGGRLCAQIPGGTANPWTAMIGQNDVPLEAGQPYTLRFTATATKDVTVRAAVALASPPNTTVLNKAAALTGTPRTFEFTGTSTVATRTGGQVAIQAGGASAEPYTLCIDDVSLTGGVVPPGGGWDHGSPVRTNQYAYPTAGAKRASIVSSSATPLDWQLKDAAGTVVQTGKTQVKGRDAMTRDDVHIADFSAYRKAGSGYSLTVGNDSSYPFDIADKPYDQLRRDSLAYFYHNRSGTPIEAKYVGDAYARPAGHVGVAPNRGDVSVPCLPGECDYTLDVSGGWYDAGDHGKYVVNGALAAWQLMDTYERSLHTFDIEGIRDGLLSIPEQDNRRPDVLDEARWEVEFLLKMQVPAGKPLAGMAHHKIHDLAWTGHPMLPGNDPQPRYLHAPSTAATLNLAAAGARCARVFKIWDRAFSDRCLAAAETAWQAALANPAKYAPDEDSVGGGAYDDTNVTDEFSWAGAELHATTGKREYLTKVTTKLTSAGFSWKDTGGLADLTIMRLPLRFPLDRVLTARARLINVADGHLRDLKAQGYPNPSRPADGQYAWGSTSATLTASMIMAMAHDTTLDRKYSDGVLESMDYLLGRNGLNQSFVSGYGERASRNQHHRHWAHSVNAAYPNPPAGSLAGGPNSGLQDPVAQQNLPGCAPAKCYIDELGSWSTNEVAINWNSALAWVAAFADTR
ncbi:endoglucanase [Lentzea sp. NBRC 102530]|nr:endoglucanase [Lentzea sp. NBRC 102530]